MHTHIHTHSLLCGHACTLHPLPPSHSPPPHPPLHLAPLLQDNFEECFNTLQFAVRCSSIQTAPHINILTQGGAQDGMVEQLMQQVCACVHACVCVRVCVCVHACVCVCDLG